MFFDSNCFRRDAIIPKRTLLMHVARGRFVMGHHAITRPDREERCPVCVWLPKSVRRELKRLAWEEDSTITAIVADALADKFSEKGRMATAQCLRAAGGKFDPE